MESLSKDGLCILGLWRFTFSIAGCRFNNLLVAKTAGESPFNADLPPPYPPPPNFSFPPFGVNPMGLGKLKKKKKKNCLIMQHVNCIRGYLRLAQTELLASSNLSGTVNHALNGTWHKILTSGFFHESVSPRLLSIPLGLFLTFSKICGDIHGWMFTPVSMKLAISCSPCGVTETSDKFIAGVNNTGD